MNATPRCAPRHLPPPAKGLRCSIWPDRCSPRPAGDRRGDTEHGWLRSTPHHARWRQGRVSTHARPVPAGRVRGRGHRPGPTGSLVLQALTRRGTGAVVGGNTVGGTGLPFDEINLLVRGTGKEITQRSDRHLVHGLVVDSAAGIAHLRADEPGHFLNGGTVGHL